MNAYTTAKLILSWAVDTWGQTALDPRERAMRLLEEAAEAAQSLDVTPEEAERIVARTYSRPKEFNIAKELGGVFVCLYGLCAVKDLDPDFVLHAEVMRCITRDKVAWRLKHDAKFKDGTSTAPSGGPA